MSIVGSTTYESLLAPSISIGEAITKEHQTEVVGHVRSQLPSGCMLCDGSDQLGRSPHVWYDDHEES